jgi:Putative adhesin
MRFQAFIISVFILSSTATARTTGRLATPTDKGAKGQQVERTIKADAHVAVTACVISGSIEVHGWDKNEVRARANDAAEIEFQRKDGTAEAAPAGKIVLLIADKAQGVGRASSCQSFSDIHLDVPRGASVQLQTRDGDIRVFDVATAYVNTQSGDVVIERATKAVDAGTIGGGISLRDSSGCINLHSIGGNIEAAGAGPVETSDVFEAGTVGGDIALDRVAHAHLNAHTLNGALSMSGPLAHQGRYAFKTISGDITLTVPEKSSFQLSAKISQRAELITDLPLTLKAEQSSSKPAPSTPAPPSAAPDGAAAPTPKPKPAKGDMVIKHKVLVEMPNVGLRNILAVYGSGDAVISLASFSGTIHLRKQ